MMIIMMMMVIIMTVIYDIIITTILLIIKNILFLYAYRKTQRVSQQSIYRFSFSTI